MSDVVLQIKGVKELMKKLDSVKADEVKSSALFESGQYLSGWIKEKRLSGERPKFLGVVSGLLRASINYSKPEKDGDEWVERIGTNVIYARIHEFGGVIRPKNKKYLRFKVLSSMRFMSLRGNKRLRNPVGSYRWVATKKVTIPARPFMRPAIEDAGNQAMVVEILKQKVEEALEK